MKNKIIAVFILFLLTAGAKQVVAGSYLVSMRLEKIEINGQTIFDGDSAISFTCKGKSSDQRQVIFNSKGWEIAMSIEIKPGGSDPSLKKYGIKGKTWQYKRHIWYRRKGGEWVALMTDANWGRIQRNGSVQAKDNVSVKGGNDPVTEYMMSATFRISKA